MKFGIDAKWFHSGPPSGQMVVQELCKELLDVCEEPDELWFFVQKKYFNRSIHPKVTSSDYIYTPSIPNFIYNSMCFPLIREKANLDAVLFQNFVPLYGKTPAVGFVQDLLFLTYPQYFSLREKYIYQLMVRGLSQATVLVVTSDSERQRMTSAGVSTPIRVVPLGVSTMFKPISHFPEIRINYVQNKYQLPGEYMLYLGRFNVRKNLLGLLQACLRMNHSIPLVLAGPKDSYRDVQSLIDTLRADGKTIITTGYVDTADLPILYGMATLFCFPSFAEGFGLPPLEAMASGVPVVVSDTTSLPEVCGDAAEYFDPNDWDSMAVALDKVLDDPKLRQEMVTRGLARSATFTWKKTAQGVLEALQLAGGRMR